MDESLLREIHYLSRLIEHHKKKSSGNLCCAEKNLLPKKMEFLKPEEKRNLIHVSQQLFKPSSNISNIQQMSTNVYINPNFKPQSSAIHINPKLRLPVKPLVHVNPKMMQNVIRSSKDTESNSVNSATDVKQNSVSIQNSVKKSVHVNPKLMKKLSSTIQSKPIEQKQITQTITQPVCSRLKFIKSTNALKAISTPKKVNNSSILVLSRRKLIRVRRSLKRSSSTSQIELHKIKKPPTSIAKNVKTQKTTRTKITNALSQSISKDTNLTKAKINKYRIDRTVSKTSIKENVNLSQKKNVNKKMELITIEGIVYKSSKNQLVRRSYGLKRKRITNAKSDKFIVATNGKKLCRIKSAKEIAQTRVVNTISTKLSCNVLQKTNYKNNMSNKVKQRSIQILRNKMQKNNQPCLIYQRFGYCTNHEKGTCPKRHDKKQIFLCKKFLQGNCLLDKCPLSHDVGPEKMPTCKYFLEGCCNRDACPYRHVKVSSSTPICIAFLRGYCAKGSECKQRHENLCPEFEKTKNCSKGKHCPYPHKLQSSCTKQNYLKRKCEVSNAQVTAISEEPSSSNCNSKLRYYEQTDTLKKSIDKRRESALKKVKLMKRVETAVLSDESVKNSDDSISVEAIEDDDCEEVDSNVKVLKRPPIGVLPAYIPIN